MWKLFFQIKEAACSDTNLMDRKYFQELSVKKDLYFLLQPTSLWQFVCHGKQISHHLFSSCRLRETNVKVWRHLDTSNSQFHKPHITWALCCFNHHSTLEATNCPPLTVGRRVGPIWCHRLVGFYSYTQSSAVSIVLCQDITCQFGS